MPKGFKIFPDPKQFKALMLLGVIFIFLDIVCLCYGAATSAEASEVFACDIASFSTLAVLLLSLSLLSLAFIKTKLETVEKNCEEANMPGSNPENTTFLTKSGAASDINNTEHTRSPTDIEAYPDGTPTENHREQIQALYRENKISKEAMGRLIGMINVSELDDQAAARARSKQIRNLFENLSKNESRKSK